MKRGITDFAADEDPSGLFDEALDIAALEDASCDDADDTDFEVDLRMLAAARAATRASRRRERR